MQTITTKYFGPGNVRGSRISATTTSGIRKYWAYDDALSSDDNHRFAARVLADSLDWQGSWVEGAMPDNGRIFVLLTGDEAFRV